MNWFLYDIGLRRERVKQTQLPNEIFQVDRKMGIALFQSSVTLS